MGKIPIRDIPFLDNDIVSGHAMTGDRERAREMAQLCSRRIVEYRKSNPEVYEALRRG
jgi:hypothetical protein